MIDSPYAGIVAVCIINPLIMLALILYWEMHDDRT